MKIKNPHDIRVGANIRAIRLTRGLTQQALGALCGVKFQQIQKYETGMNRVSASRIVQMRVALECNLVDLFAGTDENTPSALPALPAAGIRMAGRINRLTPDQRAAVDQILTAIEDAGPVAAAA